MMDWTLKLTLLSALTLGTLASCSLTPIRTPVSDAASSVASQDEGNAPATAHTMNTRQETPMHSDGL